MQNSIYEFEAAVQKRDYGRYFYSIVCLPENLVNALIPQRPARFRVHATIAEVPIDGAFQKYKNTYYLILNKKVMRSANARIGDVIEVRFSLATDDDVVMPDALRAALLANEEIGSRWSILTPGARRSYAHYINSAKSAALLHHRLEVLFSFLATLAPSSAPQSVSSKQWGGTQ